jgi:hypothetical protein
LFSRIPFLRKFNLREIISIRGVLADISAENIVLNNVPSNPNNLQLVAPSKEPYYEYSLGIGNIFKVFRIDFNFRGNYKDDTLYPDARKFGVTGSFGFYF